MITKYDIQQLLEEARNYLSAEIDRGDDGFVIRAHYDEDDETYSIYLTDPERIREVTSMAYFAEAVSIAMEALPRMIEEARRKSREYARPPAIARIDRDYPGIMVMAIAPDIAVHRTFIAENGERSMTILHGNGMPIDVKGNAQLVAECAKLIRFDNLQEADDLIYGGARILSSEVGEERHIVTVKPRSRVFDSYWVATLLVVPGCAYVVGWASDTSYAQPLHDAVVEAAKRVAR